MHHITENELRYWLTLLQAPQMGMGRVKNLLAHFTTIENICKATQKQLQSQKLTDEQIHIIKNPSQRWNDHAIQWKSIKNNRHIMLFLHPDYPRLLNEIASGPVILYIEGERDLLNQPQIAIVGSRNPSVTGLELAEEFAMLLANAGFVITSGLALGIDAASHHGALKTHGKTVAVLGSGLNNIYPSANRALAKTIIENGCLVSEFPLHQQPHASNFPKRNRVISGLSLGTLVVEAAVKSGSLITAKFALEQNREVFAIPGSIRNPTSQGCLSLIQQGAKCVTSIHDILDEINSPLVKKSRSPLNHPHTPTYTPTDRLDQTEQQVLACCDDGINTVDQICTRSRLSAPLVTATLLRLELKNIVRRYLSGYITT